MSILDIELESWKSTIFYRFRLSVNNLSYVVIVFGWLVQEKEPKKKNSIQRNAMASALKIQRKAARTIAATVDDIQKGEKRLNWWNRWQN